MQVLHRWVIQWTTGYTTTQSEVFIPTGPWQRAEPSATKGRGWFELRAEQGTASVAVGFQTATDPNSPDTHVRVVALATTEGVEDPDALGLRPTGADRLASPWPG